MITTIEGANLAHLRSKDRGCGSRKLAQEADLASEPDSHSWAHTQMVQSPERGWGGAGGEQAWGGLVLPRGLERRSSAGSEGPGGLCPPSVASPLQEAASLRV